MFETCLILLIVAAIVWLDDYYKNQR